MKKIRVAELLIISLYIPQTLDRILTLKGSSYFCAEAILLAIAIKFLCNKHENEYLAQTFRKQSERTHPFEASGINGIYA